MAQYGWVSCPVATRMQVQIFCEQIRAILGEDLIGIYLHGSLAMGCFNPEHSDIDLLVVTARAMALATRRQIIEMLLQTSNAPHPIEISFLVEAQMHPFQHPLPFDLHYSETWRQKMHNELANGTWQSWNATQRRDPDLSAHLTILWARGIVLYGRPIGEVLPDVPGEDYSAAIVGDYVDAREERGQNPVYFVLNACRVLTYCKEHSIVSKDEGGVYGLKRLPQEFHALLRQALESYRGEQSVAAFDEDIVDRFMVYMDQHIGSDHQMPRFGDGS
jgi:predicted nucleotidyltransferase